jgi:peptide deformylase
MGDPRLLRVAEPVRDLRSDELGSLLTDLYGTVKTYDGVGIAAPQIGVKLQVVIFGCDANPRYPDVPPVPETVLINPVITVLGDDEDQAWEGCLSVPGLRGWVPRPSTSATPGSTATAIRLTGRSTASTPASFSTNAIN